jgi:hypothetical protein
MDNMKDAIPYQERAAVSIALVVQVLVAALLP